MAKFDPKIALKNVIDSIKDYGDIQAERTKLVSSLLGNVMKSKQNWFFKTQAREKQQAPLRQLQQSQAQGGGKVIPYADPAGGGYPGGYAPEGGTVADPFTTQAQPQVRYGRKGDLELYNPSPKNWIHSMIQEKQKRGHPLTEKEQKFLDKYLFGTTKGGEPEKSPYTAEWKTVDARSTLFAAWMKSLEGTFPESKWDKGSWTWSKNEIIRETLAGKSKYRNAKGQVQAGKMMKDLELTTDDFFNWAKKNQPDLAKLAFPGRFSLK